MSRKYFICLCGAGLLALTALALFHAPPDALFSIDIGVPLYVPFATTSLFAIALALGAFTFERHVRTSNAHLRQFFTANYVDRAPLARTRSFLRRRFAFLGGERTFTGSVALSGL